ncbi:MAG: tetratricopeptide repeat protein, partial [bacterium]
MINTICLILLFCAGVIFASAKGNEILDRGNYYYRNGQYNRAIILYKKALEIGCEGKIAYFNLGNCYYRQNELGKAASAFERSIEASPDFAKSRMNLGAVYARLGSWGKAIVQYQQAAEQLQNDKIAWLQLGDAFMRIHEPVKALSVYYKVFDLDMFYVPVYYAAAEAYLKSGDTEAALEVLHVGTQRIDSEIRFWFYMASICSEKKQYSRALLYIRKGLNLDPENRNGLLLKSDILCKEGHTLLAISALEKLLDLDTASLETRLYLAELYFDNGWYDKALNQFLAAACAGNSAGR